MVSFCIILLTTDFSPKWPTRSYLKMIYLSLFAQLFPGEVNQEWPPDWATHSQNVSSTLESSTKLAADHVWMRGQCGSWWTEWLVVNDTKTKCWYYSEFDCNSRNVGTSFFRALAREGVAEIRIRSVSSLVEICNGTGGVKQNLDHAMYNLVCARYPSQKRYQIISQEKDRSFAAKDLVESLSIIIDNIVGV